MDTQNLERRLKLLFNVLFPLAGIGLLFAGLVIAIVQAHFTIFSIALCLLGLGLFLLLFIRAEIANLKYYLNVVIYSAAVAGLCVVAYLFSMQYTKKVDLTEQQLFSLSEASVRLLENLDRDVTVAIFMEPQGALRFQLRDFLNRYADHTDHFNWEVHDPRQDITVATQYGERVDYGDVFIKSGDKQKRLSVQEILDEKTLSNAILEVTTTREMVIYFTTGHGEIGFDTSSPPRRRNSRSAAPPSLEQFRNFLTERAMKTVQLDLATRGAVPDDASLVVVAGPAQDLLPQEVQALEAYLEGGGKLLVHVGVKVLEPGAGFGPEGLERGEHFDNLFELLQGQGVQVGDHILLDLLSQQLGNQAFQVWAFNFAEDHPITENLSVRGMRFGMNNMTRSVVPGEPPEGMEATELIMTSPNAFPIEMADLIDALKNGGQLRPPAADFRQRCFGVAVAPKAPQPRPGRPAPPEPTGGPRLVVYGNNDLINDSFLARNQMAAELMLNTVNWLTEQEEQIAVPPRQIEGTPITLTPAQRKLIFVLVVVALPALLFFGGISYTMLRRRG